MGRNIFADEIVNRVSMLDAFMQYGYRPNKNSFICCPFHKEKTPSLGTYQNGKKFKCFGCGSHGSVIDFVMKLFGIDFKAAVLKLNYDFSLGLQMGERLSIRQQQEMRKKARDRLKKEQENQRIKDEEKSLYWSLWGEWIRLDTNRRKYAPKSPDEEWHPLFVEALRKIDYQNYLIDTLL